MTTPFAISSVIAHVDAPQSPRETTRVHDGAPTFGEVLEGAVESANRSSMLAGDLAEAFAAGARDDIHGTMLAASKADIEVRFVGAVRNKVIDAFYELWRMQI
jgi:flagellar hook-basal body complex protein FliE